MEIFLVAGKLSSSLVGNKYRLELFRERTTNPAPDFGLDGALSDQCYPTIESLCDFVDAHRAMDAHNLARLRDDLEGEKHELSSPIKISEESALRMGFKLP